MQSDLEVATTYHRKVIGFYDWFRSRQSEIHADELRRLKQKEDELLLAIMNHKLDLEIATVEHQQNVDEVFVQIFMSRDYQELETLPPNSINRAERAIEILERRFTVPEETKHKIYRLYYERARVVAAEQTPPSNDASAQTPNGAP